MKSHENIPSRNFTSIYGEANRQKEQMGKLKQVINKGKSTEFVAAIIKCLLEKNTAIGEVT